MSDQLVGAGPRDAGDVERHRRVLEHREVADVEIRRLAIECLRQLIDLAPQVFSDFEISTLADGTEVATSPLATEA